MKALKRFLLLALALIMSLSLFACANNNNEDPNGPGNNENPPGVANTVEKYYEYDYQALEDGKLVLFYEGTAPTEVLFGSTSGSLDDCYEPDWEIVDDKILIDPEDSMMEARDNLMFYYVSGDTAYKNYFTVNPITENYFKVDSTTTTFKLALADIVSAKFNGTDVASVAGITKDATGLTFTQALLQTKLGHNQVEIKTADKTYILSVCPVTKKQLAMPITFEDGQMTPFITVFGNDYAVIKGKEAEDTAVKEYYATNVKYAIGTAATKIDNVYTLEIDHRAGSPNKLQIFVSSYYLYNRVQGMKKINGTQIPSGTLGVYGMTAAQSFLDETSEEDNSYKLKFRILCSYFETWGGIGAYYSSVNGEDVKGSADKYLWPGRDAENKHTSIRNLTTNNMLKNMVDFEDGSVITPYQIIWVDDAPSGSGHKIYIDDIAAGVWPYGTQAYTISLPENPA